MTIQALDIIIFMVRWSSDFNHKYSNCLLTLRLLKAKNPFHVTVFGYSTAYELLARLELLHSHTIPPWLQSLFHIDMRGFSRYHFVTFLFPFRFPWCYCSKTKVEKLRHTFLQLFPFERSATAFSTKRRSNSTLAPCRMQQYYSDPGPPTPPVSDTAFNSIHLITQYAHIGNYLHSTVQTVLQTV